MKIKSNKLKQISTYYNGLGFISQMANSMYYDVIPCIHEMITEKENGVISGGHNKRMERVILEFFQNKLEDEKLKVCKDLLKILNKLISFEDEVDLILETIE